MAGLAGGKATWLGGSDSEPQAEGTFKWDKPGGEVFWTGGDPSSGGKVVSGKYHNFKTAEPQNAGAGQDCVALGVIGHVKKNRYITFSDGWKVD